MERKKDIIFFSHSTRDKKILGILKDMLFEKFGGSVEIFLSSDGQSIPLGRNWVHSVEQALNDCKIMFVFLTSNSIKSQWTYFEAGYVYSKKIKVIPIGMFDIDLNKVPPPLGLLQGFNIISFESLNNIIKIVNEEFN